MLLLLKMYTASSYCAAAAAAAEVVVSNISLFNRPRSVSNPFPSRGREPSSRGLSRQFLLLFFSSSGVALLKWRGLPFLPSPLPMMTNLVMVIIFSFFSPYSTWEPTREKEREREKCTSAAAVVVARSSESLIHVLRKRTNSENKIFNLLFPIA